MSIYTDAKIRITHQDDYDNFNSLIFSPERNIIFKLLMRNRLYDQIRTLHGDIVECGVFKGSGVAAWLKMMDMDAPHDIRKVIGFDFYDPSFTGDLEGEDKKYMEDVFSRCEKSGHADFFVETINEKLLSAGFKPNKFELVKGDITLTSKEYLKTRPGFRISLLYMDLDIEHPTYETLINLWDRIVPGGIIAFDEYAYPVWSEANGVDRFIKEKGLKLNKLDIKAPTAYIVKL